MIKNSQHSSEAEIRRGLVVAAGLALGVAVSNGLGRFAYALILPAMRGDLGWNYTQAGALGTANAVGYLVGSIVALVSVRRLGASVLFQAGMWVTAAGLLATGLTSDFNLLIALRFVVGVSGAVIFITGSVLAASIFPDNPRLAASAISIYFAGGGVGLLLPGLTLPWLIAAGGDAAWPWAWVGMGIFSLLGCFATAAAGRMVDAPARQQSPHPWPKAPLLPTFVSYACFALGYFAYMTFIIAWMREHGADAIEVSIVWGVLGVSTILSSRIWSGPIASWRGGRPLAAIQLAVSIGAILPLFATSLPALMASAALFGFFFMIPAGITALIKKSLPAVVWGEAVAAFTLLFSALQRVGPIFTGMVADRTGSLAWGLGVSGIILLIGTLIALFQREVGPA